MGTFIAVAKWNSKGVAGVQADGYEKGVQVVRDMWESMGATVESVYF